MIQSAARTVELHISGQKPVTVDLATAPVGIGRDKANAIVLAHGQVSRQHAELLLRDGLPVVRDRGSSNGTIMNGERLARGAERALTDGDTLGIGPYHLVFRSAAPAPAGTSPRSLRTHSQTTHPADVAEIQQGSGARELARRIRTVLLRGIAAVLVIAAVAAVLIWLFAPPLVSVLILGSDARPNELAAGDRGRTDTLVAYIADREAGRNLMISIPRDLWVQTSPSTVGKINTAYRVGGPDAARRAVTATLGIPIDRHLVIGLQGVRDVVNALGGIDVDVETAIRDEHYPTDDYGVTVFEISAGRHHLDGETALRYARTRYADDDLARIGRQQRVLAGIRAAASNPLNIWRLPGTLLAVQRTTDTNIGPRELATLVAAFARAPGAPERFTPTWNMVDAFISPQGEAALRAQPALRDALATLLVGPSTSIEVLNASGRDGTARRAADALVDRGLNASRVGTADRLQASSAVLVRSRSRLAGQSVASVLAIGPDAVRDTNDLPGNVDVRVVLGSSYTGT